MSLMQWFQGVTRHVKSHVNTWMTMAVATVHVPDELVLHRFEKPYDLMQWSITTDEVVGGFSTARLRRVVDNGRSCALFTGKISLKTSGEMVRSGFATFRSLDRQPIKELHNYEALQLSVKTDGRPYLFNVRCNNMTEHLFQARVLVPKDRWCTIAIPFEKLALTHRGAIVTQHASIDQSTIDGFGLLIADGQDGPFRFELETIKALRYFNEADHKEVSLKERHEVLQREEEGDRVLRRRGKARV